MKVVLQRHSPAPPCEQSQQAWAVSGAKDKASDFTRTPITVYELWSTSPVCLWNLGVLSEFGTHERYENGSSGEWRLLLICVTGKKGRQLRSELLQYASGRKLCKLKQSNIFWPLLNDLKKQPHIQALWVQTITLSKDILHANLATGFFHCCFACFFKRQSEPPQNRHK